MDDIVKAAMNKWPNVPHCYGWLALDARGQWRMRDERCQTLDLPGDVIRHPALINFINRNYTVDERGCWFFQNGPQRVYVDLETTPYILRTTPEGLIKHTGDLLRQPDQAYLDENGRLFIKGDGLIHIIDDRDLMNCVDSIRIHSQSGENILMAWLDSDETTGAVLNVVESQIKLALLRTTWQEIRNECFFVTAPKSNQT
ncbi:DUF2946 family protein [Undibacterium sp. SXout7W]|uniref:DUF2946 family protein n=1 Tax=Undibacterium sp. SXout7W TaxID=3413049 RepID=UPI003BEF9322